MPQKVNPMGYRLGLLTPMNLAFKFPIYAKTLQNNLFLKCYLRGRFFILSFLLVSYFVINYSIYVVFIYNIWQSTKWIEFKKPEKYVLRHSNYRVEHRIKRMSMFSKKVSFIYNPLQSKYANIIYDYFGVDKAATKFRRPLFKAQIYTRRYKKDSKWYVRLFRYFYFKYYVLHVPPVSLRKLSRFKNLFYGVGSYKNFESWGWKTIFKAREKDSREFFSLIFSTKLPIPQVYMKPILRDSLLYNLVWLFYNKKKLNKYLYHALRNKTRLNRRTRYLFSYLLGTVETNPNYNRVQSLGKLGVTRRITITRLPQYFFNKKRYFSKLSKKKNVEEEVQKMIKRIFYSESNTATGMKAGGQGKKILMHLPIKHHRKKAPFFRYTQKAPFLGKKPFYFLRQNKKNILAKLKKKTIPLAYKAYQRIPTPRFKWLLKLWHPVFFKGIPHRTFIPVAGEDQSFMEWLRWEAVRIASAGRSPTHIKDRWGRWRLKKGEREAKVAAHPFRRYKLYAAYKKRQYYVRKLFYNLKPKRHGPFKYFGNFSKLILQKYRTPIDTYLTKIDQAKFQRGFGILREPEVYWPYFFFLDMEDVPLPKYALFADRYAIKQMQKSRYKSIHSALNKSFIYFFYKNFKPEFFNLIDLKRKVFLIFHILLGILVRGSKLNYSLFLMKYFFEKDLSTFLTISWFKVELVNLKPLLRRYMHDFWGVPNDYRNRRFRNPFYKPHVLHIQLFFLFRDPYLLLNYLALVLFNTHFYSKVLWEYNSLFRFCYQMYGNLFVASMQLVVRGRVIKRKKDRTVRFIINRRFDYGAPIVLTRYKQSLFYAFVPAPTRKGAFGLKGYFLYNKSFIAIK